MKMMTTFLQIMKISQQLALPDLYPLQRKPYLCLTNDLSRICLFLQIARNPVNGMPAPYIMSDGAPNQFEAVLWQP
ncbi:hypothetical protein FGO68_gene8357 [Halteria grandinella]|uniref:Uncharacterized protein n=1 Tax=Halteria grandinella TaxID=5974 RepID=A0A8J8NGM6_HALGN|nr:hypothetical protein FGO68_gene8357 [Halteria grandinella]